MAMEKFHETMMKIMPILLQREMQQEQMRGWLEKSLKEYAAWGEEQKLVQERGAGIETKQTIVQAAKEYFADDPYAFAQFISIVNKLYPEKPVLESYVPEDLSGLVRGAEEATTGALMAEQAREPITQEVLSNLVRSLGPGFSAERVGSVLRERRAEEERGLTARGLAVEEELIPVRKGELGVRKEELEIEKKGKPSKEDEKRLKILSEREKNLKAQLEDEIDIEKTERMETELASVREQKTKLLDKMEVTLNMEKINKILSKLRSHKANAIGLEKYKEKFKAQEGLTEVEYQYIKANL